MRTIRTLLCMALALGMTGIAMAQGAKTATLTIEAGESGPEISRHIYGHFAEHLGRCVYDGIWVGPDSSVPNENGYRKDIIDGLKAIKIPNLRWPGGCFADQYHWKEGVGPNRPDMINMHWGGYEEDNSFGTHEFLDYCELIGAEAYLAGNVGSGTVEEMADWVEYTNSADKGDMAQWRKANGREEPWGVEFWGVGNENWGCGGDMTPEYYADLYRQFHGFLRDYDGTEVYKVACGANSFDYNWTDVVMGKAARFMDGISLHYYTFTGNWRNKGSATDFDEGDYMELLGNVARMDELIAGHVEMMDKHDPRGRVGLLVDEWGNWWDPDRSDENLTILYQQNTVRDAITAGITLNILNSWARRVKVANIAQLVNVLQALFLTKGEEMILTPTYHVFDLYQVHHDANLLTAKLEAPDYEYGGDKFTSLHASSSKSEDGRINLTLVHTATSGEITVTVDVNGAEVSDVTGRIITGSSLQAHNTFDAPENVKSEALTGASVSNGRVTVTIPPLSVVALTMN